MRLKRFRVKLRKQAQKRAEPARQDLALSDLRVLMLCSLCRQ